MEDTHNDGGRSLGINSEKYPLHPVKAKTFPSAVSLAVSHREINHTHHDLSYKTPSVSELEVPSAQSIDVSPNDSKLQRRSFNSVETQTFDLCKCRPLNILKTSCDQSRSSNGIKPQKSIGIQTTDELLCETQVSEFNHGASSEANKPAAEGSSTNKSVETFDPCTSVHVLRFLGHRGGTSALMCIFYGEPFKEAQKDNILFMQFYENSTGQGHAEDFLCYDLESITLKTEKRRKDILKLKENETNLYVKIFLSNSPCKDCARQLVRFRKNLLKSLSKANPVLEIQVMSIFNVRVNKPGLLMLIKSKDSFTLRCLNWFHFYIVLDHYRRGLQDDHRKERRRESAQESDPKTIEDIIRYLMKATAHWTDDPDNLGAVNSLEKKTNCTKRELNELKLEASFV